MNKVQIESITSPLDRSDVAPWVMAVLRRADAMGLVNAGRSPVVDRLDVRGLVALLQPVAAVGIGARVLLRLANAAGLAELRAALRALDEALRESPSPKSEWKRARNVLGPELLGRLLGVSPSSLQRYADGRRETPAAVADRLHYLALLSGDLLGAYNELGVRLWFDRPRVPLGGRPPATFLKGEWRPEDQGPARVRALAEALVASPAT